ncbi:Demethylmenaquinone methyltransferase [Phytophthora palmivora]|uniref:Demethylmenaquinone methyltransferase n=1 Tax=Phytophthora palmivora TaxID=4796 RepID=A0A2P4YBW2_9STRA|nr:Demethylmenaquinone methyltransferase [Phytophthora palmivora]
MALRINYLEDQLRLLEDGEGYTDRDILVELRTLRYALKTREHELREHALKLVNELEAQEAKTAAGVKYQTHEQREVAVSDSAGHYQEMCSTLQEELDGMVLEKQKAIDAANDSQPPEVQQRLAKLSVCAIADAMAKLKIQSHLVDVSLVRGFRAPLSTDICGPAFTVHVVPATGPAVKKLSFHYVDKTEKGQVIVISAPDGSTTGVFGGLLAAASKARGAAGVVTDGRVRDVQEISSMGFPAFSRGTSVHGQQGATTVMDINCPVIVGGCVVRKNDIIRGDVNGVIVVPIEHAAEVAAKAEVIEEQDKKVEDAVKHGAGLQQSFKRFRSKL